MNSRRDILRQIWSSIDRTGKFEVVPDKKSYVSLYLLYVLALLAGDDTLARGYEKYLDELDTAFALVNQPTEKIIVQLGLPPD